MNILIYVLLPFGVYNCQKKIVATSVHLRLQVVAGRLRFSTSYLISTSVSCAVACYHYVIRENEREKE